MICFPKSHPFLMLTRDAAALVRFGALACVDALVNSLREAVRCPSLLPQFLVCCI